MDLQRLRSTEWFAGLLGAGLLAVLFVDWYAPGRNAWESFAVTDVVLALAGLMGVAIFLVTAVQPTPAVPVALESLGVLVSTIAVPFALVALLKIPDEALHREVGPGLALPLTAGVALACLFGVRNERPGRRIAGRPVEAETQPAP